MQVAPKSVNLRHHRAESPFSSLVVAKKTGSEITEIAPSPSENSVFDLELDRSRWLRNRRICATTEQTKVRMMDQGGRELCCVDGPSTSSWTDAGGSEISEFAPSPSGLTVFDLELD